MSLAAGRRRRKHGTGRYLQPGVRYMWVSDVFRRPEWSAIGDAIEWTGWKIHWAGWQSHLTDNTRETTPPASDGTPGSPAGSRASETS